MWSHAYISTYSIAQCIYIYTYTYVSYMYDPISTYTVFCCRFVFAQDDHHAPSLTDCSAVPPWGRSSLAPGYGAPRDYEMGLIALDLICSNGRVGTCPK